MGRSQVLYNRTAARMRASRGRGRDTRRGTSAAAGAAPSRALSIAPHCTASAAAVPGGDDTRGLPHTKDGIQQGQDDTHQKRTDEEVDHLLSLSSATSTYISQTAATDQAPRDPLAVFVNPDESAADTQALCSHMTRVLDTVPATDRMRLPQHVMEALYGTATTTTTTRSRATSRRVQKPTVLSSNEGRMENPIVAVGSDEATVQARNHSVADHPHIADGGDEGEATRTAAATAKSPRRADSNMDADDDDNLDDWLDRVIA